jgi:putative thioredoxin
MMSEFIFDATEADFEFKVLARSQEIPVIVDFWAEWCAPCRVLGPILEKLTNEANGQFRLARVNVDENPNLAKSYDIRSIPVVKAFKDGRMVSEFVGARPENQIRDFIRGFAPNPGDLALEKGLSLLQMHQPAQAEIAFRQTLQTAPDNPQALLGFIRSLLYQGKAQESLPVIQTFPASREYNTAQMLLPLVETLQEETRDFIDPDDTLDAAFDNSVRLIQRGNFEASMDGLLDILRQDKNYRNGLARQIILAIFELIGENDPVTREYRQELASVLF